MQNVWNRVRSIVGIRSGIIYEVYTRSIIYAKFVLGLAYHVIMVWNSISMFPDMEGNNGRHCSTKWLEISIPGSVR